MTSLELGVLGVLHLSLLWIVPSSNAGSVISLQATPHNLLTGLSSSLTIGCSLNKTSASASIVGRRDVTSTADDMTEVTSIILMKDGSDVASVSHSRPAHIMDGSSNVKVTGSVAGGVAADGTLEVTFQNPTQNNSGEFVCEINAVSESGHIVTFSASQEVSMATPSTVDIVAYIRQLGREKDELADKYAALKAEVETKVLFSAVATRDITTSSSSVVAVFDKVFANVGGAYNPHTGQFVCGIPGYYEFEATFLSSYQQRYYANLEHNGQVLVNMYGRAGTGNQGQSTNSAIIKLAAGDVVRVMMAGGSSTESHSAETYSSFSGKLVALL